MGYLLVHDQDGSLYYLQAKKAGRMPHFSKEKNTAKVFDTIEDATEEGLYFKDEFFMKCQIEKKEEGYQE